METFKITAGDWVLKIKNKDDNKAVYDVSFKKGNLRNSTFEITNVKPILVVEAGCLETRNILFVTFDDISKITYGDLGSVKIDFIQLEPYMIYDLNVCCAPSYSKSGYRAYTARHGYENDQTNPVNRSLLSTETALIKVAAKVLSAVTGTTISADKMQKTINDTKIDQINDKVKDLTGGKVVLTNNEKIKKLSVGGFINGADMANEIYLAK